MIDTRERPTTDGQPNADTTPANADETWSPTLDELRGYTGRYYSDELESFYELRLTDDILTVHHIRLGDISLGPVELDVFSASGGVFNRIRFERNEFGEISGLRVSSGRVRNLAFEKVHP